VPLPTEQLLIAVLAAMYAVAGCGQARSDAPVSTELPSEDSATVLALSAPPNRRLGFDKRLLQTSAGLLTIIMDNPSPIGHGIALRGPGISQKGPVVAPGATSKICGPPERGRYLFYCPVPGHRRAGMQGVLQVR
jgi:hypothetical protein